jgi:hypothetical protein
MAQRRMISKSISTSTKLAEVSTFSKLLFSWILPHCDDYGHMDGSAKLVKGIVVPLCDESTDQVESSLQELEKAGLIKRYEVEGKKYLEIDKWGEHQTLKNDRSPNVDYPLPPDWNPKDSKRNPMVSKRKHLEKQVEEELEEEEEVEVEGKSTPKKIGYLKNIPKEDIQEFLGRFHATEKQIKSKAEDLMLYCQRKGRTYKNYKSFLLNALKRDFQEREAQAGGKYSKV